MSQPTPTTPPAASTAAPVAPTPGKEDAPKLSMHDVLAQVLPEPAKDGEPGKAEAGKPAEGALAALGITKPESTTPTKGAVPVGKLLAWALPVVLIVAGVAMYTHSPTVATILLLVVAGGLLFWIVARWMNRRKGAAGSRGNGRGTGSRGRNGGGSRVGQALRGMWPFGKGGNGSRGAGGGGSTGSGGAGGGRSGSGMFSRMFSGKNGKSTGAGSTGSSSTGAGTGKGSSASAGGKDGKKQGFFSRMFGGKDGKGTGGSAGGKGSGPTGSSSTGAGSTSGGKSTGGGMFSRLFGKDKAAGGGKGTKDGTTGSSAAGGGKDGKGTGRSGSTGSTGSGDGKAGFFSRWRDRRRKADASGTSGGTGSTDPLGAAGTTTGSTAGGGTGGKAGFFSRWRDRRRKAGDDSTATGGGSASGGSTDPLGAASTTSGSAGDRERRSWNPFRRRDRSETASSMGGETGDGRERRGFGGWFRGRGKRGYTDSARTEDFVPTGSVSSASSTGWTYGTHGTHGTYGGAHGGRTWTDGGTVRDDTGASARTAPPTDGATTEEPRRSVYVGWATRLDTPGASPDPGPEARVHRLGSSPQGLGPASGNDKKREAVMATELVKHYASYVDLSTPQTRHNTLLATANKAQADAATWSDKAAELRSKAADLTGTLGMEDEVNRLRHEANKAQMGADHRNAVSTALRHRAGSIN